ncbi:MAG: cytochrome c3 family protein [Thermodesulfobacteriota bacterium]
MKTRKITATIVAITIGLAVGIGTVQANEQIKAPAKSITITGKKPVKFNHTTHLQMGVACAECHHDEQHNPRTAESISALPDSGVLQCATCHNSDFANPELQKRKTIFHANCKTCHKTGLNGKKGPTKCSGCHLKKKRKAIEGC